MMARKKGYVIFIYAWSILLEMRK